MIRQTFSENGDNEQSEPTTENNNINNNTKNNPRKGEDKSKTSSVELVTASFPNQTDQSKRMKNQSQDRRSEFNNNSQEQSSLLSSYQQSNGNNLPRSSQKVASRLRSTTETRTTAIIGQQDNTQISQSGASSAQSKQYPKNRLSYEVASEENGQFSQSQPRQSKLNRQINSREDIDLQSGQIHLIDGHDGSVFQEQSKSQSRHGQKERQSQQMTRQYEERQNGLAEQKELQKVRSISEQQSYLQKSNKSGKNNNSNNNNNSNRQSLQFQDLPRKQENRQLQEDNNPLGQQQGRSNFKHNNNNNSNTFKQQQFEDILPVEVKGLRTKEKPTLTVGQSTGKYPYEDASSPTRSVAQASSQLSSPKVQFGTPTAPILQARSMALQLRNTLSSQGSNHSDLANKLSIKKPKNVNEEEEEEQKEGNEQNSQNVARPISNKELEERIKRGEQLRQQLAAEMDPQETWSYFEKYQPISHGIINMKQLASSEFLRLKRYKQGYFYGDIQNLTKTGQGIMAYFTGKLYEGEWQNDTKFGKGFELQPNGSSYQGYFVNGKPEGYGEYIWNNGESYQGDWVNGLKHGQGTWLGQKGDSYSGEWKFGKADGKGKHTWVNGDVYEGDFKCCLKHGQGEERFANNDTYVGQYANGRPEGQGIYNWSQGAIYKGGFKNGLRHGKGMWVKNKDDEGSDSYEGDYLNDKRCGQGVFHWASGNVYKGEYFDDLRNGYGEMFWTDGSYYKGDWEKGVQCGEGELHIVGEGIKKGLFANNSLLVPASSSAAAASEINSTKQQYRPEVLSRILPNVEVQERQKLNQRSLPPMYQQRLLQEPRSLEQLPSEEDQIDEQHLLAGQPIAQQQQVAYLPTYQSQEVQPKQWAQQSQQPFQEEQNDGRYQTNEMPQLDIQQQQQLQQSQYQVQQPQQQQQQTQQYLLAEQLQRKYQEELQLRQRAEMQLEQELFLQRELQGLRQQQEKLNEQQLKQEQQLSRLLPRLQSRSSSSDTQSLLQSRNIFQNSTNKTRQPLSTQQDDYCQTSLTPPSTQTQTDPRQQDNNIQNINNNNNIDEQTLQQYQKQQEQLQEQQLQQLLQLQQQQQQQQESQQMPFIVNKRHSSVEKERESKGTQTVLTHDRSVSTESQMKPKNKGLVLPRLVPLSTKRSQQSGHHRHRNNNNSNSVSPNRERDRDGQRSPAGQGFDSNKPCLLRHQEIILWQSMRNKLGIPARELNDFSDPKTVEIIRAKIHPPIWKPTGVARFLEESPSKQILLSAVAASGLNNAGGGQLNTKPT